MSTTTICCLLLYNFELRFGHACWSTGGVDRHRWGRPADRVAGRVEILQPAGQAGWKTSQILLSGY